MANIRKFKSVDKLQQDIEDYFKTLKILPTWHSLLFSLGISRQVVSLWKDEIPEYYELMTEAKERIIAMLTEVVINQSYHPAIRIMEKKGKPRYMRVEAIQWYLKNLDHEQFSDNPDRVHELKEQSTITLNLENKGVNKVEFEEVK
jgi:hypothetical protein